MKYKFVSRLFAMFITLALCINAACAGDYEDGQEAYVKRDYQVALIKFRNEAAQGNMNAQLAIGIMYEMGQGVAKDNVEAARWYKLAAAKGNAGAQFNLASMYYHGRGVAVNVKEAVRLFKLAGEQGDQNAQVFLAVMYINGDGINAHDDVEAVRWYKLAAAQGNVDAQFYLASMYFGGLGVAQDYVRAHMWSNLASIRQQTFILKRDAIASAMTPQQIAEAQKLATECQARNFKNCD